MQSKHGNVHVIEKNDFQVLDGLIEQGFALPIEINEEWLIKLGFIQDGLFVYGKLRLELGYNYIKVYYDTELNKKFETLYLHQLQNLYFSLTGKELIYTP